MTSPLQPTWRPKPSPVKPRPPYRRTKTGSVLSLATVDGRVLPSNEPEWSPSPWPDLDDALAELGAVPSPDEEQFTEQKHPEASEQHVQAIESFETDKPLVWIVGSKVAPLTRLYASECGRFMIECLQSEGVEKAELFAYREGHRKALGSYLTLDEAKRIANAALGIYRDNLFRGPLRAGWKKWFGRYE